MGENLPFSPSEQR